MGLREAFAADQPVVSSDCPTWRWLDAFAKDDREFLIELMENPAESTDKIILFIKRQGLPGTAADSMNHHRMRRCPCNPEHGGRRVPA